MQKLAILEGLWYTENTEVDNMIDTHKLKTRSLYLNKLIAFKDTEPVKVITGIRRCGKSSLLKMMIEHLRENGVDEDQIIEMNFESFRYRNMSAKDFYEYVSDNVLQGKRMYMFFDEVQRIPAWEDAVNSFRVDFNCDIYITGSNAYLLSSEYMTYLAGRCVEIKMLPLSFREFAEFYGYSVIENSGILGEKTYQITDDSGAVYDKKEVLNTYLRFGGMPGIADVGLNQEKAMVLLDGIYSTVIMRDIMERENFRGNKNITDPVLLRKIVRFLADNIGSSISVSSIGNTLADEGLIRENKRGSKPSVHTVQSYVDALIESYFFYEIKRFDIKGKEYLRTLGKYYISDIGMRNYLLGVRERDIGHVVENVVYFELLRRGYDVAIGKISNMEIDFIATSADEKIYIQVTQSMTDEKVIKRELAPLKSIDDNYEKLVLSLDPGLENTYNGIKSLNLYDWLLRPYKMW